MIVDRNTQRCGVTLVAEESRNGSVLTDKILRNAIQLLGRDARPNVATHFGQGLRYQEMVFSEQFNLLVRLQIYHLNLAKNLTFSY